MVRDRTRLELDYKGIGKVIEYSFWQDRGRRECTSQGAWWGNVCGVEQCSGCFDKAPSGVGQC